MRIKLPPNLYKDDRVVNLKNSEKILNSNITDLEAYKNILTGIKVKIKDQKKSITKIKAEIKKLPPEVVAQQFVKDQERRINSLPIDKFETDNFYYDGQTYNVYMFVTKKLVIADIDPVVKQAVKVFERCATDNIYESQENANKRNGVTCITKSGKELGRFLVVIIKSDNSKYIHTRLLDNPYYYSLPCVSGIKPCFGSIGGVINSRINENKIGNVAEIMIDYLTSPTYAGPYVSPKDYWKRRTDLDKAKIKKLSRYEYWEYLAQHYSLIFASYVFKSVVSKLPECFILNTVRDQSRRYIGASSEDQSGLITNRLTNIPAPVTQMLFDCEPRPETPPPQDQPRQSVTVSGINFSGETVPINNSTI